MRLAGLAALGAGLGAGVGGGLGVLVAQGQRQQQLEAAGLGDGPLDPAFEKELDQGRWGGIGAAALIGAPVGAMALALHAPARLHGRPVARVAVRPSVPVGVAEVAISDAIRQRNSELAAAGVELLSGPAFPGSHQDLLRRDPAGFKQLLIDGFDRLTQTGSKSKLSSAEAEASRRYVRDVVENAPLDVLERATVLHLMPVTEGLAENLQTTAAVHGLPPMNIRAQADAFVASLPPAEHLVEELAGFDALKHWLAGPPHDLAARTVERADLSRDQFTLRHLLAYDRAVNNRMNHGWHSAALGALAQGGADSVEAYFRRLGETHGQELSDWGMPMAYHQIPKPTREMVRRDEGVTRWVEGNASDAMSEVQGFW
jgi:hypothetical protein